MNASGFVRRHDTSSFTDAQRAEMLIDPYDETPKYAKASVGFVCGVIAIAGFFNLVTLLLRKTSLGRRVARSRPARRAVAAYRWIETSQPRAVAGLHFPTWGTIGLIVAFWLFVLIWSLAVWPYYRSRWNVGSPPLAMRTGLFALGCFPFILAFGAKWSIVGFVVGASHEKLQVYHQWMSHLFLILSFLHTFPFVVQGMREVKPSTDAAPNPDGLSQIAYAWHIGKVYYWSGTAALITLCWLCWASFTPLRQRAYEIFKITHILAAIIFSWAFYKHCNALLGSYNYLWATAILYLTSVFMRFGLLLVRTGRHIPKARVETLADNAVRVSVDMSQGAHHWKAGTHYFVNFFRVLPFESHPYTIANIPATDALDHVTDGKRQKDTMELVFRVHPHKGLGPRLLKLAASASPTTHVLLDGPYGGPVNRDLGRHDAVVLIAGGAGFSFSMAILQDLTERTLRGDESINVSRIEVHWAVRNPDAQTWFADEVERCARALRRVRGFELALTLYVTDDTAMGTPQLASSTTSTDLSDVKEENFDEKSITPALERQHHGFTVQRYRPHFPTLLSSFFAAVPAGTTVGIGACGPVGLTTDVRRAVGAYQWRLAKGEVGETAGAGEVELVTEVFDW